MSIKQVRVFLKLNSKTANDTQWPGDNGRHQQTKGSYHMKASRMKSAGLIGLALACLGGCANIEQSGPVAAQPVTVYVLPNCQVIGENHVCNWIEPAEHSAPKRVNPKPVAGIAL